MFSLTLFKKKVGKTMVENLGTRISSLRKELNLSQEALAQRVGVTRQALSKWERNEATPDIYNLSSLAAIFGVSVDDLVTDDIYSIRTNQVTFSNPELKIKAQSFLLLGIGLLILGSFVFVIDFISLSMKFIIFAMMMTAGVLLIIKAGFMLDTYRKLNQDILENDASITSKKVKSLKKQQKKAFEKIVSTLCTLIYLYLGFFYMLWHPGWLIFLIIPIASAIYDLVIVNNDKA